MRSIYHWLRDVQIYNLLSNKDIALSRLTTFTRTLNRTRHFQAYDNVFKEWLNDIIIQLVSENNCTTKIRPISDASTKDKNNQSLNMCLQKRPNLIEMIPSLLIKFKLGLIRGISDIKKTFLQISFIPKDRNVLKFCGGKMLLGKEYKFTGIQELYLVYSRVHF